MAKETLVKEPVKIIFDTDMGNDVDDALALAMIHALVDRGECELLAVTLTKDNPHAAPFVDLVNTFYGRPDIPIGVVKNGVTPADGKYLTQVSQAVDNGNPRYSYDLKDGRNAPEATTVLRKTLSQQPDRSVVIVQVGFSTNLARLLESGPDEFSSLKGKQLVEKKVRLLSAMAGAYDAEYQTHKEYNVVKDIPSAQTVFHDWPTPIIASGFEVGMAILYPGASMQMDYNYVAHHPIKAAYAHYRGLGNDQPTWDLTSVLYVVRPDRGYFDLSPGGKIKVNDDSITDFRSDLSGSHHYLQVSAEQITRIREAMIMLCSQPPVRK